MKTNHMKTISPKAVTCLVLLAALAAPASAWAHTNAMEAAGFLSGVHHPISGWDHVLAMIAVGLWGAQLGSPAMWLLPVTFPIVMALGAMLGLLGIPLSGVEIGIALSAIVLGAMVLAEKRPALWVAAGIVGFFAIFHGHAHGTELPAGQSGLLYSMGFVMATGCLHGVGIGIGLIHRWAAGRVILRAAGATVALAGMYFLFSALT
jgi:urease accessory protein